MYSGNPGIGGTEYVMLVVAQQLTERPNDIDVLVYVERNGRFAQNLNVIVLPDIEKAIVDAANKGCARFIYDPKWIKWNQHVFEHVPDVIKLIPWNHNICRANRLHDMCSNKNVGKLICVGKEHRDLYRDDWTFGMSDFIYNCVPYPRSILAEVEKHPFSARKHIVTYVGSLTPRKTFHVLAQIWPDILKEVPDAELYVIGSASLYDDVAEYGPFHVAEKSYEAAFMPYLSEGGKILDSVHFMGRMGAEKNDILLKTKVGVPNPAGKTETFCLTAIEMQIAGCVVAAMPAPGYFDTIFNGVIAKDQKRLTKAIVDLLRSDKPVKPYAETTKYIEQNFGMQNVAEKWEQLIKSDLSQHMSTIQPLVNRTYRLKWLKECVRHIKQWFPVLKKINVTLEDFIHMYEKYFVKWEYKMY